MVTMNYPKRDRSPAERGGEQKPRPQQQQQRQQQQWRRQGAAAPAPPQVAAAAAPPAAAAAPPAAADRRASRRSSADSAQPPPPLQACVEWRLGARCNARGLKFQAARLLMIEHSRRKPLPVEAAAATDMWMRTLVDAGAKPRLPRLPNRLPPLADPPPLVAAAEPGATAAAAAAASGSAAAASNNTADLAAFWRSLPLERRREVLRVPWRDVLARARKDWCNQCCNYIKYRGEEMQQ